jgi:predicted anti-sigma-YlaC factor YlaD
MKCSQVKRRLSAFLDGEVSEKEKLKISEHLKSCIDCQKELESLSYVSNFLDSLEEIEPSPYFIVRLKQRIAEQESKRLIRLPFMEWARRYHLERIAIPVGVAASLFLAVLGGSNLGRAIYKARMEMTSKVTEEFADVFSVTFFNDYTEGSLGSAYNDLLIGEEK